MILESIVTTVDINGRVNIAPMGPTVETDPQGLPSFVLRPFDTSQTYLNLCEVPFAVVHVTDDVGLLAAAAVGEVDSTGLVRRLPSTAWYPLIDCHRWFAVAVESLGGKPPRVAFHCRTIQSQTVRPFFGFNRAKHAVIEAAILATRIGILPAEEIRAGIERLQPLVDKTAGPVETEAFRFLRQTIDERLGHA